MPILSNSLYYPAFALTMFVFMLALVHRKEIKPLFWFSLVWGSGVDIFLILLFHFLNLYIYLNDMPFDFYGSPILLNLAWTPAILLFIYFMPKQTGWFSYVLYLATFGMIGTLIGFFLQNAGLIKELHWHELLRFPVITGWFYIAAWRYKIFKSKTVTSWK